MKEYLTIKEVAQLLGVSPHTVRKYLREGRLKGKSELFHRSDNQMGYHIVISKDDLEDFEMFGDFSVGRLNAKITHAERTAYLTMLDLMEERLYEDACLIAEMRERLEKIEL